MLLPVSPPRTIIFLFSDSFQEYNSCMIYNLLQVPLSGYLQEKIAMPLLPISFLLASNAQEVSRSLLLTSACESFSDMKGPDSFSPSRIAGIRPSFLYLIPTASLSVSLKRGIFTAPGIWPELYSEGDLTSHTGILSASSRNFSTEFFPSHFIYYLSNARGS